MLTLTETEARLDRLYAEQREMEQHPEYPFVGFIPGWQALQEEIDRLEDHYADLSESISFADVSCGRCGGTTGCACHADDVQLAQEVNLIQLLGA